MIVDATAMIAAIGDPGVMGESARAQLSLAPAWHAPAHMAIEVVRTFDRLARHGKLAEETARLYTMQMVDGVGAAVVLHADRSLLPAAWALRANLSTYDAVYVALAETLRAPLLTADLRLVRACGSRITVIPLTQDI
ncbi:MAG: type II toxin-antitoxin system VapC family toxin [Micromonosporaceae bacterium]|nr:type II toxin-antitoxin system VapC family toxin [Micromonosporaceae bacterium]